MGTAWVAAIAAGQGESDENDDGPAECGCRVRAVVDEIGDRQQPEQQGKRSWCSAGATATGEERGARCGGAERNGRHEIGEAVGTVEVEKLLISPRSSTTYRWTIDWAIVTTSIATIQHQNVERRISPLSPMRKQ